MRFDTAEEWLTAAVDDCLRGYLATRGVAVPPVRVSVGFGTRGVGAEVRGQTLPAGMSADGVNEIYIRPTVHDPAEVLTALIVELVRASLDAAAPDGERVAKRLRTAGLVVGTGKGAVNCASPGDELLSMFADMAGPMSLGDYPRENGLDVSAQAKKQTTRMIKCLCGTCGFTFRTTAVWIARRTLVCPDEHCRGPVTVG